MSKILTFIIGAVAGLILGGGLIYYLFVGTPAAVVRPGEPILIPEATGPPSGTAQIVLKEEFFNSILQTIFRDLNEPEFPLKLATAPVSKDPQAIRYGLLQADQCEGTIKLLEKGSEVQTAVLFEGDKINSSLALSGKASVFGNCIEFNGWAKANLELRFEKEKQIVYGILNVETVNIDGISPILSGIVTPLIQNALNQNVNPIEIVNGKQLSVKLPISATNGNFQAAISDVRAEVKDKGLNLFITYDFTGDKSTN